MTRLIKLAFLGVIALALTAGSALGRAGIIDVEGVVRLYIRPVPTSIILGGPIGGPYAPGPFTGNEPFTIAFVAANAIDPNGGSLTFQWNFTYDGYTFVTDATGPGPVSHTYPDGPTTCLVALRLTSTSGAEAIIIQPLTVQNVAPTANAGGPYSVTLGSPITFAGSATDPSAADNTAGFRYEWDFNYNGTTFNVIRSGLNLTAPTYTYPSRGVFTVALRVTDKDNGVSAVSKTTATVLGATTMVTQTAMSDSGIKQGSASTNYGTATTMAVTSKSSSGNERSLVGFDLSGIQLNSNIVSATLSLYAATVPGRTRSYELHAITSPWTESVVTWATMPTMASDPTSTANTSASAGWMSWNVTSDVQAMANGTLANRGWLVQDAAEGSSTAYTTVFDTREYSTDSIRPKLDISYRAP